MVNFKTRSKTRSKARKTGSRSKKTGSRAKKTGSRAKKTGSKTKKTGGQWWKDWLYGNNPEVNKDDDNDGENRILETSLTKVDNQINVKEPDDKLLERFENEVKEARQMYEDTVSIAKYFNKKLNEVGSPIKKDEGYKLLTKYKTIISDRQLQYEQTVSALKSYKEKVEREKEKILADIIKHQEKCKQIITEFLNKQRDNLSDLDLHNAVFPDDFDLEGIDLTDSKLARSTLIRAKLTGAKLTGANLTGAKLMGANLTGAKLTGAKLMGAKLMGANLTGANMRYADLTGADLTGADLTRANVRYATFTDAVMTRANFTDAMMTRAIGLNLSGTIGTIRTMQTGVGFEVHNVFKNIDSTAYLELINQYIKNTDAYKTDAYKTEAFNIVEYCRVKMVEYMNMKNQEILDSIETKKLEFQSTDFKKINAVLNRVGLTKSFNSPENKNIIGRTIDFVFKQPPEFIENYIHYFINDCFHAYNNEKNTRTLDTDWSGISCAKGINERLLFGVKEAALMFCLNKNCKELNKNGDDTASLYIKILKIFKLDLETGISIELNDITQKWSTKFLDPDESDVKAMLDPEDRKQHYLTFVLAEYKNAGIHIDYDLQEKIEDEVEKINYVFSTLQFGGLERAGLPKKAVPEKN